MRIRPFPHPLKLMGESAPKVGRDPSGFYGAVLPCASGQRKNSQVLHSEIVLE